MRSLPRFSLISLALVTLSLTGCSSSVSEKKLKPTIFAAGDKATVGSLVYNITDAETAQQLGDDSVTPRTPKDRFYLVQVSVFNSGNGDADIPAMNLVDEAGVNIAEQADGTGVQNWLGVVRKAGPSQTVSGYVLFDAPVKHYRLRINDSLDDQEIAVDMPVSFVHDQKTTAAPVTTDSLPTSAK